MDFLADFPASRLQETSIIADYYNIAAISPGAAINWRDYLLNETLN